MIQSTPLVPGYEEVLEYKNNAHAQKKGMSTMPKAKQKSKNTQSSKKAASSKQKMTKSAPKAKKTTVKENNLNPIHRLKSIYRPNGKLKKLRIILSLASFVALYSILSPIYKDWDNAQFLKGMAVDFPALVSQIEQETGLELEIKNGCFTTQEKLGEGKGSCSLSVGRIGFPGSNELIQKVVIEDKAFTNDRPFENNYGLSVDYRGKPGCRVAFNLSGEVTHSFFLSCTFAVREANQQLLKEIFVDVGTPE